MKRAKAEYGNGSIALNLGVTNLTIKVYKLNRQEN